MWHHYQWANTNNRQFLQQHFCLLLFTNSTSPCLLRRVPLFAPSVNKATENVGHKYLWRSPGSRWLLGSASPFFTLTIHLHTQTHLSPFLGTIFLSVFPQHLSAPLSSPEEQYTHTGMLLRPFQRPPPNRGGCLCSLSLSYQVWGNQQGGIRLPIEGGVVLASHWV